MTWEEYKLQCYYLGRYADIYQREGLFNNRASQLIEMGLSSFEAEGGVAFLEEMISHGPQYEIMDIENCPILIYTGDKICYGVLDGFARSLLTELDKMGFNIEEYNLEENGMAGLADFAGKRFRAVIGFQTYGFSVLASKEEYIHDLMVGPKFHMILDHPVWMRNQLTNAPKNDYYVLTHDENYVRFIERYYPSVKGTFLVPPAGEEYVPLKEELDESSSSKVKKIYDISFVGSYHDWRLWIPQVLEMNRKTGGVARRFLHHMLNHRNQTWEQGLEETLKAMGRTCQTDEEFRDLLFDIKPVCFVVMSYFREKIMDAIVEADVSVHVFGDSWKQERYKRAKNLIRHGNLTPEESLQIYAKSKISLNIMSWHKAGMTERIANMMLNHAVVVTDESTYLTDNYVAGTDYLAISLEDIQGVPKVLKSILEDTERQSAIAESAYHKAVNRETWECRARKIAEIVKSVNV